jgi:DNA helicase MCM8
MYGTHGESASRKKQHHHYASDDVVNILATYCPSNELAVDEEKLMLTCHLIHFFSNTPPGEDLASQVPLYDYPLLCIISTIL